MNVCPLATVSLRRSFRVRPLNTLFAHAGRRCLSSDGVFEEGDTVVLKRPDKSDVIPILIRSLQPGQVANTRWGDVNHDSIIGKKVRHELRSKSSKSPSLRAFQATLAEYVTLSPRRVTPIYPDDASLIVSLLDLHVHEDLHSSESPTFEILEAGTGHGSLTLYLSRAIHGANNNTNLGRAMPRWKEKSNSIQGIQSAPRADAEPILEMGKTNTPKTSKTVRPRQRKSRRKAKAATESSTKPDPEQTEEDVELEPAIASALEPEGFANSDLIHYMASGDKSHDQAWKQHRRAIIHTVDRDQSYSRHAESIVRGFRDGIYAHNVDFHVADVAKFINDQYKDRGVKEQIFNHIILDMPGVHNYMEDAARALRDDGTLIVFAPSVTQIARCVQMLRQHRLPLAYETCLELGTGLSTGRTWDVRAVRPSICKPHEQTSEHIAEAYYSESPPANEMSMLPGSSIFQRMWRFLGQFFGRQGPRGKINTEREQEEWVMVCRPKAGTRIVGGGFLGVWKRKRDWAPWENGENGENDGEIA